MTGTAQPTAGRTARRPPAAEILRRGLFLLVATPAILRAAGRLRRHDRQGDLGVTAARLRAVPRWRWRYLDHPRRLAGAVDRLLPVLPLGPYGRCLARSLLLLDLWGRSGLEVEVLLGLRPGEGGREGHAWAVARRPGSRDVACTTPSLGHEAAFRV